MATLRGSLSRSLLAAARSATRRPPPLSLPLPRRRLPLRFAPHRSVVGELRGFQSLLPLHSVVAAARLTPHLSANARACCELSQGT